MGFLIGNNLIAIEQGVGGHLSVSYPSNSTYYVACYNSIDVGQLVEEGATLGPVRVHYKPGIYSHIVKAKNEQSGDYYLHTESYESKAYSNGSDEYQLIV